MVDVKQENDIEQSDIKNEFCKSTTGTVVVLLKIVYLKK